MATGNNSLAQETVSDGLMDDGSFRRFDWKQQITPYATDAIFVMIFICALILHSHQTEATYRLDFIWKLQATGASKNTKQCSPMNTFKSQSMVNL